MVKREYHQYDEEWRTITSYGMNSPVVIELIPSGIILGFRMSKAKESLVVNIAKEAGIKTIYKSYTNAQNQLDLCPINI